MTCLAATTAGCVSHRCLSWCCCWTGTRVSFCNPPLPLRPGAKMSLARFIVFLPYRAPTRSSLTLALSFYISFQRLAVSCALPPSIPVIFLRRCVEQRGSKFLATLLLSHKFFVLSQ